ncbi:unnamed protein product, partial [Prorocentrum cordatum]
DVVCRRFGGEGVGSQAERYFSEWTTESTYHWALTADAGSGRVRYEGYFHAAELGGWVLLAKVEVAPVGPLLNTLGSFVEHYSEDSYHAARWGRLGRSFVRYPGTDDWLQVRNATLETGAQSSAALARVHANVTDGGTRWGLGSGVSESYAATSSHGDLLSVAARDELPPELADFRARAAAGLLPGGCAGGTCNPAWMWVKGRFRVGVFLY